MENYNCKELVQIMKEFAESGWNLIAAPSKAWLEGNGNSNELLEAIVQADKECGNCGCQFDPLYKRAIELLKNSVTSSL